MSLRMTNHGWQRCLERDISIESIQMAKEYGLKKINSRGITYEFNDLLLHCSRDGVVITTYRNSNAGYQSMDPSLTFDEYKSWHRLIQCVWEYDAETIFESCHSSLMELVDDLCLLHGREEMVKLFTCRLKLAAQETIPVVDVLSLLVGRRDTASLSFLQDRFGLLPRCAPKTTANFIESNQEKNLFTPFFEACSKSVDPMAELNILRGQINELTALHSDDYEYQASSIEQCDMNGWNPLIWAGYLCTPSSSPEQFEKMILLLSYGSSILVRERRGYNPLHVASMGGNAQCVRLLLTWRAYCVRHYQTMWDITNGSISSTSKEDLISFCSRWDEFSPIEAECAAIQCLFDVFSRSRNPYFFILSILKNGCPILTSQTEDISYVNIVDWNGNSAMHYCKNADVMRVGLEFSADLGIKELRYGITPFMSAVFYDKSDIVDVLLGDRPPGVEIDLLCVDKDNKDALRFAIEKCKVSHNYQILRRLLTVLVTDSATSRISLHSGQSETNFGSAILIRYSGSGVLRPLNQLGEIRKGQPVVVVIKCKPASHEIDAVLLVAPIEILNFDSTVIDCVNLTISNQSSSAGATVFDSSSNLIPRKEADTFESYKCRKCGRHDKYNKIFYMSRGYEPRQICNNCKR